MTHRISIAMATYNGGQYLQAQLDSFLAQSRRPDELVVCDDRSTDETVAILEAFRDVAPFDVQIFCNAETLGYVRNFEKVLAQCSGDIIFLSDQDDVWFPEKLEAMIDRMTEDRALQVLQCDMVLTDADLDPTPHTQLGNIRATGSGPDVFVAGCGTAIRREWREIVLPIPADMVGHDNWIHRLAGALDTRQLITDPLQYYRRHAGNASNSLASRPARIGQLDVLRHSGFRDVTEGWQREIDRITATVDRISDRRETLVSLGLGRRIPGAIARLQAEIADRERRIALVRRPRPARVAQVFGLWWRGGYSHFSGWKSAVKDLIRP